MAATLRKHFKLIDPANKLRLADCFYHEDMMRGFDTVSEAKDFIGTVTSGLQSAGMSLSEWKSNSEAVRSHLRELGYDMSANPRLKLLGIVWCTTSDTLSLRNPFTSANSVQSGPLIKRKVLQRVASFFDPMGWCIPFTLRGKFILKDLWELNLDWDQLVPGSTEREFRSWCTEGTAIASMQIPRASVVASRLQRYLTSTMHDYFSETFLYTDSTVTYYWVTAADPGQWKPFVANRVLEIQAQNRPEHKPERRTWRTSPQEVSHPLR